MSVNNTNNQESVDEQLVAYLDGELAPDDCRAIEQKLADDAGYRERLKQMQKSWDLLDELPREKPDPDFAQTTVNMVAVRATQDQQDAESKRANRSFQFRMLSALALLAALVAGHFLTTEWLTQPDQQFLEDLPVIENVDLYAQIDDIEFLKTMAKEQLFAESEEVEGAR